MGDPSRVDLPRHQQSGGTTNPRLLRGDRSAVILRINRTRSLDISGENALPGHDFPQIIDEPAARFKENVYLSSKENLISL